MTQQCKIYMIFLFCAKNQLTAKYLSGDPSATSDIYRDLLPRLLLTAYHYCRNRETARDLVHDVFEKLIGLPVEKTAIIGRQ